MRGSAAINQSDIGFDGMLRIPGGTFRMGSDKHYPEEAPVHRVTVDAFHIDRTPVTNRQLARLAHMSVRAFERKFHSSFHLTPQKYLRNLRMRMAAHGLVYTDQLLAQVASNCGFASQSHFSREFRRYFGRTPREYREHYALGKAAAPGTKLAAAGQ